MAGAIGVPHSALTSGVESVSTILESYVFASGIAEPEISNILSYKYPQYYLTALLDRIDGGSDTVAQNVWSWFEMDRTRKSFTSILDPAATISTTTVDIEINNDYEDKYFVVGDVVRLTTGATGRVTAVAAGTTNTTKEMITLVSLDGSTWTADDAAGTGVGTALGVGIGHVFNAHGEASTAPDGRVYTPEEKWNYTTILRRSFKVSGTEATNRTYIGSGGAWFFEIENIEMKEFARDKEGLVMFGVKAASSSPATRTGAGLWELAIDNGVKTTFAAATGVTETDIQDTLKDMMVQGASDKLLGLCGSQIYFDAQRALRDYHVAGSINYGGFGGNEVGLDVQSYRLGGQTLDLVYYALFDDTSMLPTPDTPAVASAVTDFANAMLILDMGTDDKGKKLISLKYKALNGSSRKFIHAYEDGLMSADGNNGGKVANGGDYFSIHYLCEMGLECRLPHRLGSIRATS